MVTTHSELTDLQQQVLLDIAEQGARAGLAGAEYCAPHADWYPAELRNIQACFVSLRDLLSHNGEQILGSVGTAVPQNPLVVDAARNAYEVALLVAQRNNPFDVGKLELEIVVLSPLHFLIESTFDDVATKILAGNQGVFVRCHDCAATFLPSMWRNFTDSREFLNELCCRAGLESGAWPSEVHFATFTTQCFSRILDRLPTRPALPR
jgi:uncharacterized protein